MSNWDNEVQDTWEGFGLGVPVIAWGEHRKGEGIKDAIIVPTMIGNPKFIGKGYVQIPDMEEKEIPGPSGDFVSNPKYGQPKRWENNGKIKQITVLTLITDLHGFGFEDFLSEQSRKRVEEALAGDDDEAKEFLDVVGKWGLRRLYITGGVLEPKFKKAVKAVGSSPQPAGLVTVTHGGKVAHPKRPNVKVNEFDVAYAAPNAASLARVQEYVAKAAPIINKYLEANAPEPEAPASAAASLPPAPAAAGRGAPVSSRPSEDDAPF